MHLGRNNPRNLYTLREDQLESSMAEKDSGVLVDDKLSIQADAASQQRRLSVSWAMLGKASPASLGR